MSVIRINGGVVIQKWDDVDSLSALKKKYDLSGPEFIASQAVVGQVRRGGLFVDLAIAVSRNDVNSERNARLRAGFDFSTGTAVWRFDSDAEAVKRITGAATLAGFAMAAGAGLDDYLWPGGADPFSWILSNNEVVQIDAPTMFAIGRAAAANETAHIFAARGLKELAEIPADFRADNYWP